MSDRRRNSLILLIVAGLIILSLLFVIVGVPGAVKAKKTPVIGPSMPLDVPPPRKTRFGSPLVPSRVHWVEPKLVAEITYLTWTADRLLRHTVYLGLRSDKPATQVRRENPSRHS